MDLWVRKVPKKGMATHLLVVKKLPANADVSETQVRSMGQIDPLEKGMATHSSILA